MRTLQTLLEEYEKNPGNGLHLGVTNHLTPIGNIITNVRNLFGSILGIVVEPGEDGVSLKLHSSKFVSEDDVEKVLKEKVSSTSLKQYIIDQGLTKVKLINLGSYYIVYFGPNDIRTAEKPDKGLEVKAVDISQPTACTEMHRYGLEELEMDGLKMFEAMDDEELEDNTKEQLLKFIDGSDKVKCANKLAEFLSDDLDLPNDYYFKGVKDAEGNESIALRYRFTKRRPFGKEVQMSKSLLNIYRTGDQAVWVEAFLNKDYNSDEMNSIIEKVLNLIGATKTDDPCVYAIAPSEVEELKKDVKDNKKDKDDSDDLNKNENEEDISNSLKNDEKSL